MSSSMTNNDDSITFYADPMDALGTSIARAAALITSDTSARRAYKLGRIRREIVAYLDARIARACL